MTPHSRVRYGLLITTLTVGVAATVVWAQSAPAVAVAPASLAALTEELHQLRLAVQDSAKTQSQMQAMTVYLSAQQSRLTQISTRLDKAHADTLAAGTIAQQMASQLAEAQAEVARAKTNEDREQLNDMVRMFKGQSDSATERENQCRTQETELLASFRTEEARWLDLIARLEELTKR